MHIRRSVLACCFAVFASAALGQDAGGKVPENPDFSPVTAAVDTDKDGRMSRAEWEAAGLPDSSFNMFENGRDYVTQADYEVNAAPPGIDMDGDGKLTVDEFIAFDKAMSANMPPGGGPPGAAPPPGDGPPPGAGPPRDAKSPPADAPQKDGQE